MINILITLICFYVAWRILCRMTGPLTVIEPPPPVPAVTVLTPSIVIHVHKASIGINA
jgi:hypothetical protein